MAKSENKKVLDEKTNEVKNDDNATEMKTKRSKK